MAEEIQQWADGKANILAVILHGWGRRGPNMLRDIIAATEAALGPQGGVDIYAPRLPYASVWCSTRAVDVLADESEKINRIVDTHGPYERIVLIGYSLGAVMVRRLFLISAGTPPGFQCEEKLRGLPAQPWAARVDRLITLGAFNRGWQASERLGWAYSIWLNAVGFLGHLSSGRSTPTIFDIRLGAPFIVQTRLNWLAYRRFHKQLRSGTASEDQRALPVAVTQDPIVVQLIGTKDNLASPFDQVDIVVDLDDASAEADQRRYFFLELRNTDHERAKNFDDTPDGRNRRDLFMKALTETPAGLLAISHRPEFLPDDLPQVDPDVTDAVFIMHGIRDDGFWTHRIAKSVRERAPNPVAIKVRTPTYGYFAMLPFVLPWIRRQKVEWFMDQYVSARAQFPNARISFVGHSNGTYLAARGLRDYPAATFRHVYFAGSVVARDYDWQAVVDDKRVEKVHNVRASADWVVALLPKSIENWKNFDLGGAGFDGFDQAGTCPALTQPATFAKGGHSAAIVESQWPQIAQFFVDGTPPSDTPPGAFVPARKSSLVRLADTHAGLPFLIAVFLFLIPLLILAWMILHAVWGDLTAMRAIVGTLVFVGYFMLLKFLITRV
jgi:predicted esterase